MEQLISEDFVNRLLEQAKESPRLRQNFDLRTSTSDTSQRMLNALQPETEVPIHRHEDTTETVICLSGKLEEIIYEQVENGTCFREIKRYLLCPAEEVYGIQIPAGAWHTIRVLEPSVIFEAKDGAYVAR